MQVIEQTNSNRSLTFVSKLKSITIENPGAAGEQSLFRSAACTCLCALRGYWPRSCQCAIRKFTHTHTQKKTPHKRKCFSSSETARREDIFVGRPQSPSRGKSSVETKSPCVKTEVLWRSEVQARSVCSSANFGAPDCRRQGASRWMQRPICLKHTHRAGSSAEPSRPSASSLPWGDVIYYRIIPVCAVRGARRGAEWTLLIHIQQVL